MPRETLEAGLYNRRLRGIPPDRAHLAYWEFVDGPIRPFNRLELKKKKIEVATARP